MAMSKEQQQQVILAAMAVIGFPYVWWTYLMSPAMDKIKTTRADNQQIEEKVETMKRTAARLGALEKERDALLAEVGKAEKKLPKKKNLEEIIRIVTEESQRQKVFIASFSPAGESPKNYFVEIPFGINFTANFHSLARFLAAMGQQERIMAARNVSISFSAIPTKGHTVSGSFTLLTYIFRG
jgi:type IV pilus assembly protein PilO